MVNYSGAIELSAEIPSSPGDSVAMPSIGVTLTLMLEMATCAALHVGVRTGAAVPRSSVSMALRPWETANVPRGKVSMNFFNNMQQMQDQRVAGISHINLAPGKCTLPLQEAKDLMVQWKQEIGDDPEKFGLRAKSDSHCPTAANGGDLGFVVRANLCQQFDDVVFKEEPGKAYGPIVTNAGLHLIFLHSCREPKSRAEAGLGLPFSLGKEPEN